ncbi:MAG: molybdopterin-dependent oxidoreductase [bacterium]
MEISRRDFLKLLGVSTAAAAAGALGASAVFSVPDGVFERVTSGPRIETWKNSICSLCPGGCGIRVRLIDGIPVRVLGNPLYPINRGAVCPMAEAGVEKLFHPDRIKQPLKRTGKRGENQWQTISWEEALEIVANRLQSLREKKEPERFVVAALDNNDLVTDFIRRFMESYGSPNFLCISEARTFSLPHLLTQGFEKSPAYDIANTDYVLNFGADLLDEGPSPIRCNQLYAQLRSRREQARAKIIHFSPYMSRTAANSTSWIPIKPGTLAVLALSIAYVIIKDGSYDKEFITKNSFGFSDWRDPSGKVHKGFMTLVSEEYFPEKASGLTGIPAQKIVEIARDFAAAESALAISGGQAAAGTNTMYTLWAVYCLNALQGNFGKPGGVLFAKEMKGNFSPNAKVDGIARAGLAKPKIGNVDGNKFAPAQDSIDNPLPALLENNPYAVDTILFHRMNPVFESTYQRDYAAALEKVPYIISCTSFMNETAVNADLILPEHVFLESWEISRNIPTVELRHLGVQQPAIEPLYDTRHVGDIFLQVGQRLGGDIASTLPWKNYKDYLQAYTQAVYKSGEGTIVSESVELSWIEFLKKRGWQVFEYSTFDEFWDVLLEKGGWWDPTALETQTRKWFKTRSGKFEFYSQTLRREMEKITGKNSENAEALHRRWKIEVRGDAIFLPHFESPRFTLEDINFPYHFLAYQMLTNIKGCGANLALLQELSGLHSREYWHSWVEINPETAERLGIHENDYVNIISPKGSLQAKAKILPMVMPEAIMMPFGFGHKPNGRLKTRNDENPYGIFAEDSDLITGLPSLLSTKVRIEKANVKTE